MTRAPRPRLLIVNPNASLEVTRWLADEARRLAADRFEIEAVNAATGLAVLQTPADLRLAEQAVVAAAEARPEADGVLVAAFGDPGLETLRARGARPVAGLGESGLRAAARGGRRFAVVTLGAAMREPVRQRIDALGLAGQLADIRILPFSIPDMIADRAARRGAVETAVGACGALGAEAVLLGGAPFAGMAATLTSELGLAVLDGVAASLEAIETALGGPRLECGSCEH
jgi:Asp/Glu/hydantoin racemase